MARVMRAQARLALGFEPLEHLDVGERRGVRLGGCVEIELARLDQIDILFTESAPPPRYASLMAEAGVRCVVAD